MECGGEIRDVRCPDCAGTGKKGGDHIRFHQTNDEMRGR